MDSPRTALACGPLAVVIMGVCGCGKSTLSQDLATRLGWTMLEGDAFHTETHRSLMQAGVALTDAQRQGWLQSLGRELQHAPDGVVLSCSALKRAYRDLLRAARPGLRFVYLELSPQEAQARVSARAGSHFFSPSLVDSQFQTLQPPGAEPGVLTLDATLPVAQLSQLAAAWLQTAAGASTSS